MDVSRMLASEIQRRIEASRTTTSRGTVTAVAGSRVAFTIGDDPTPRSGRWVGAAAPRVGGVVVYLDEGRGEPLVFGEMGTNYLGQMSEWAPYAPSWTATGANPSVGSDGALSGRYLRGTQWCEVEIHLRAGTQTTWGSGQFFFGLPVAATTTVDYQELQGTVLDNAVRYYPARAIVAGGTALAQVHYEMTAISGAFSPIVLEAVTAATPFTLGVADMIHLSGRYRVD